ncbi:MAG: 2-phosphosulfolactate phosphatase [Chloroflexi bacterium]|nr:MAG: 2-phosphosulfolactate phosphatase [Chloroflexota bacterium]
MKIQQVAGFACENVTGLVVVIDVLRAFTTAAFAFAAGAKEIFLVSGIEEAFDLREKIPDALLMGENGGVFIPGFDYGNSPAALIGETLNGRSLIQRTSAGTQSVINSKNANQILVSSFVVAKATVQHIRALAPAQVTFVNSGVHPTKEGFGHEDIICSDYLTAWLAGNHPDPDPYLQHVLECPTSIKFQNAPNPSLQDDLKCAIELDRFPFALPVHRQNGMHILRPHPPHPS